MTFIQFKQNLVIPLESITSAEFSPRSTAKDMSSNAGLRISTGQDRFHLSGEQAEKGWQIIKDMSLPIMDFTEEK